MTIGVLARKAQVPISTLRFYERRGLLAPTARTRSGYRNYSEGDVQRVRFIRRAAELGFTLEELHELLTISETGTLSHAELVAYGEKKVEAIEEKITALRRMQRGLQQVLRDGESKDSATPCPVISSLA